MENSVQQKNYKRQDRSVSPETARKISQSLRAYNATHPRSDEWKQNQSDGLRNYWRQIVPKQTTDGEGQGGWPTDLVKENNGD